MEQFLKKITFNTFFDQNGTRGCRGFNVSNNENSFVTWMSAGHCANARYVRLATNQYVKTPEYFSVDIPPDDFLVSTRPIFESEETPHVTLKGNQELVVGEIYYTLGIYEWSPARESCLTMLQYTGINKKDGYLVFERAWGCNLPKGTSGSPIIDAQKVLVGVYHGFVNGNVNSMYPTEYFASDPYATLNEIKRDMPKYLNIDIQ
ncbi:MAG: hypothetical protein HYT93_04865 [Parcubacteria group bacterium]|nr:hypothetical protein [Parcubacteria group bacterium]